MRPVALAIAPPLCEDPTSGGPPVRPTPSPTPPTTSWSTGLLNLLIVSAPEATAIRRSARSRATGTHGRHTAPAAEQADRLTSWRCASPPGARHDFSLIRADREAVEESESGEQQRARTLRRDQLSF